MASSPKAPKKQATKKKTARSAAPRKRAKKQLREDLRFVVSEGGEFIFITPDLETLWSIDNIKKSGGDIDPEAVLRFTDTDDVFDDRTVLTVGLFGKNADEQDEDNIWIKSIRPGCHTLICGSEDKRVDFQFDWCNGMDGVRYLIGSGTTSPNIPQNEDKMQKLLFQILENKKEESANDSDPQKPVLRPRTPVSARLKADEISYFMDASPDLMCTTHGDGSLIRFNRSFEKILGFKPEQLIGKSFMDFVYDSDRPLVRNAFYGLGYHDGGDTQNVDFEARMMCADKSFRWVRWDVSKSKSGFYCSGRDVTDVKAHEQALDRRAEQLVEAQALARMGHWRWEVGSDVITWSDQLYTVFGVDKESFISSLDNVNKIVHRRDIGRIYQAFQRAIIQQHDYDMDFRIRRASDAEECFIRCEGRCELDEEGDVIALYGIMQDVTEQMKHEQALRAAKEAAESAYAAKSRFLANMSHELRTPLNAIIGFSEMIEHQILGPVGNVKYLEYIGGIRESGQHLLDLISDILDMSKIEADKYALDLEEVNISKTIRLALHMMEGRALEGSVKLVTGEEMSKGNDIRMMADRRAVMQILLNLLSNAVKFTKEGGQVIAECVQREGKIHITVEDTGVGIPAHKLDAVLKPFEQAAHEHTRDHEGTGLGLAITKNLAELHGGSVKLESALGSGTKVSVTLPMKPITDQAKD